MNRLFRANAFNDVIPPMTRRRVISSRAARTMPRNPASVSAVFSFVLSNGPAALVNKVSRTKVIRRFRYPLGRGRLRSRNSPAGNILFFRNLCIAYLTEFRRNSRRFLRNPNSFLENTLLLAISALLVPPSCDGTGKLRPEPELFSRKRTFLSQLLRYSFYRSPRGRY